MPLSQDGESVVRPPFKVGEWLAEPLHSRITRGDETVSLRPRAMAVLVCLADRAGKLASKQHIIDTVWRAEFVSDNALIHVIAELRTALGDDPQQPRYIETIPRRGYRLIAAMDLEATRTTVPPEEPEPGRWQRVGSEIGPYRIVDRLGEGGMGVVFRARDDRLGRDVAIKLIRPEIGHSTEHLHRFEQEARAVGALNHPNIVVIHDIGRHRGVPFFVTELLDGQSLRELLREGALPLVRAVEYALEVTQGLAAAHAKGIVHRDLKPENLFVTSRGQVKILDFGLAKLVATEGGGATELPTTPGGTRPGMVLGTPDYMSPEQVRGEPADERTDIFALGCVLYEMVSGAGAFARDTPAETMAAILKEEPPDLTTTGVAAPAGLERLLFRCLDKRPEARFQSASDLAFALRSILTDVDAAPGAAGRGPVARRPRALWLAAAALLVVGAAATAWWISTRTTAPRVDQPPAGEPEVEPAIRADRVVIIPFENRTGDQDLETIGLLAADWITQGMAQAAIAEVVPPTAARQAAARALEQGSAPDQALAVAEETGAGVVVSGSYYRLGDQLQLQVNLIDTIAGELLVALEPESGDPGDPMDIIDRARQRVLGAVASHLARPGFSAPPSRPPLFEAYQEFTAGFSLVGRDSDRAIEHFERAAEIDPDFTAPRLWMFMCNLGSSQWQRAEEILEGLEHDFDRLTPYERLWVDWGLATLDFRHLERLTVLRKLRRLTPDDPFVLRALGSAAIHANRPREVVDALAGIDLEDFIEHGGSEGVAQDFIFRLTSAHHLLGNHQEELAVARRGLELMPHRVWMHADVLIALAVLGEVEEMDRIAGLCLSIQDPEVPSGWVIVEAAEELRAHGHREAGLRFAARAVTWYRARPPEVAATELHRHGLGVALYLAERWPEAQEVYTALAAEYPDEVRLPGGVLGVVYAGPAGSAAARQGDRQWALSALSRIDACQQRHGWCTYYRARIEALLGNRDRAVQLLREAYAQGLAHSMRIHRDPDFEGLRGYPPFEELIRPKG